jgi:FkbM family methyltransferase
LEHFGISDTSKSISLYYNEAEFNQGMVSAYANEFSQHVDVDVISLDEYFKQNEVSSVDFIKIDIEGGEFPALIGMSETLKRFHPTLLIELDDEILAKTNFKKMQIVDFLKNIGYKQFCN